MPYNRSIIKIRKKEGKRGMNFPAPERMRRSLSAALCAVLLIIALYAAMYAASGVDPASYNYKSYLLQAQAWLRGETCLDRNYEYLELAIYNGNYYVSFPPVPSLPMLLYTLIWGDDVPGGIIQQVYIAIACLIVLSEIARSKRMPLRETIAWAMLLCFGSAMLPITLVGGVWYEAQILAFLFSVSAIVLIRRDHPLPACLCYALSVGCRPFSVALGPVLLAMYIDDARMQGKSFAQGFIRLIPGLIAGLAVAACYAIYNYIRFDNPLEFGHNYLPEFTRSEHGQLSLAYVSQNWRTLFFGPPLSIHEGSITINQFGFSMFLSCPIFICNALWLLKDIFHRRLTPAKLLIVLMCAANLFLLLMHRTLGGHQFGARYALELVPMCFAWYLISPERNKLTRWEAVLMVFGLFFNFLGGCLVHI